MVFVPSLQDLRNHVDVIPHKRDKLLIETLYLTAARANEIATRGIASDRTTKACGSEITWRLDQFAVGKRAVERSLVLRLRTLKHKKPRYRSIAIPLNPLFEPWGIDIARQLVKSGELRFNITRRRIHQIVKKRLSGLDPDVHPHSLRHYRLTHLVEYFGFDPYDLTIYAGWKFGTGLKGSSGPIDVYLHLDWRRYFGKLLRKVSG